MTRRAQGISCLELDRTLLKRTYDGVALSEHVFFRMEPIGAKSETWMMAGAG